MHRKDENLTENNATPMVSEIYTKISMNDENSSLFKNSILGQNLKSEISQNYAQKPQRNYNFMNPISVSLFL